MEYIQNNGIGIYVFIIILIVILLAVVIGLIKTVFVKKNKPFCKTCGIDAVIDPEIGEYVCPDGHTEGIVGL